MLIPPGTDELMKAMAVRGVIHHIAFINDISADNLQAS